MDGAEKVNSSVIEKDHNALINNIINKRYECKLFINIKVQLRSGIELAPSRSTSIFLCGEFSC